MSAFRVELDLFNGPLDLLLYLVRRSEVDILDLPIARITASFLEYLEVLELLDSDLAGDFVVTASSLIEIKSRAIVPQAESEETPPPEAVPETRSELVQKLLEYKRYKDAAKALEERATRWQERYPRLTNDRPQDGKDPAADFIMEVELWDLVSALARVLKTQAPETHSNIRYDDTPITVYIERIRERVLREQRVAFSAFFENENLRSRIVGVFLAILELLRHHGFRAEQPRDYSEIWVLPPLVEDTERAAT